MKSARMRLASRRTNRVKGALGEVRQLQSEGVIQAVGVSCSPPTLRELEILS